MNENIAATNGFFQAYRGLRAGVVILIGVLFPGACESGGGEGLAINEIVASPEDGTDWVELIATGEDSVDLSDFVLVDDNPDHDPAPLPAVTLAPGELFVIQATREPPVDGSPFLPFGLGREDAVFLLRGDEVIDVLAWDEGQAPRGASRGRLPDGVGEETMLSPTPGAPNEAFLERPEGWSEETHGPSAEPSYDIVFPEGTVNQIDITIAPEDWQAMVDDLTELLGEHGGGSEQPFGPPAVLVEPCRELAEADSCLLEADGLPAEGTCTATPFGLLCIPVMPEEAILACDGLTEGEPCTYSLADGPHEGICSERMRPITCMPATLVEPEPDIELVPRSPIYVPCTIDFEGRTWRHVGIRFKGNSSLSFPWEAGQWKLPFRLDFEELEEEHPEIRDQRFFGFRHITLANGSHDDALVRDVVMGDLFRAAGVPAPRASFYRVTIDHGSGPVYFGLYTMIEVPDRPMLEAQLGRGGGNLYKPEGPLGSAAAWTEFDPAFFEKRNNEDEADWSDVERAIAALHASREDPALWRAGLEEQLDVDGFLVWLAMNTLAQNWDTYGALPHNYFLYGNPGNDGRLVWIPWDNNESLRAEGLLPPPSLGLDEVDDEWPLIRFLIDDPVYRTRYVEHLEVIADGAFDVESAQARLRAAHELIRPHVVGQDGESAPHTLTSPERFDADYEALLDHVVARNEAVDAFVSSERR